MRNNDNPCFIQTTDQETAEYLRQQGFQEISTGSLNLYCFLNDRNITFSQNKVAKDITYTSELYG